MKLRSVMLLALIIFSLVNCGDNSATVKEEQQTNNSSAEKKEGPASISAQDAIIGEWELVGSIIDTNDNLQLDEEEKKNLKKATYKDYMKLNGDGSGLFTVGQMEGRYEAKAKEAGGKKHLTWYDKANGEHRIGTILSVTKDELHIKEPGGYGLFLWKRL